MQGIGTIEVWLGVLFDSGSGTRHALVKLTQTYSGIDSTVIGGFFEGVEIEGGIVHEDFTKVRNDGLLQGDQNVLHLLSSGRIATGIRLTKTADVMVVLRLNGQPA